MTLSKPLNIIFAGTPDFAAKHLQALIESEHNVIAVYCPVDKPSGRGKKLSPCAVKQLALEHNITVEQPVNFKSEADVTQLAHYNADVMVVVAYGLLLPEVILNAPRLGCINVHGSLLPKWRGAAPIQRAVEAGDPRTGVTIMQMDKGLDTGAMLLKAECEISQTDTSSSIYDKLAKLGPQALLETLSLMANNEHKATAQEDAQSSYAAKLEKSEALINWHLPAQTLQQKIRAFIPWPVCNFVFIDEKQKPHAIRIWQASVVDCDEQLTPGTIIHANKNGITVATGKQALNIELMQLPGKKTLTAADILNSRSHWFRPGHSIEGLS